MAPRGLPGTADALIVASFPLEAFQPRRPRRAAYRATQE